MSKILLDALEQIVRNEVTVFDETEGCEVITSMDTDEMVEIARKALENYANQKPDDRLFVCAPELLEVLKKILYEGLPDGPGYDLIEASARSVISKATVGK